MPAAFGWKPAAHAQVFVAASYVAFAGHCAAGGVSGRPLPGGGGVAPGGGGGVAPGGSGVAMPPCVAQFTGSLVVKPSAHVIDVGATGTTGSTAGRTIGVNGTSGLTEEGSTVGNVPAGGRASPPGRARQYGQGPPIQPCGHAPADGHVCTEAGGLYTATIREGASDVAARSGGRAAASALANASR